MKKIYSFFLLTCLLLIGTNAWADSWVKTAPADLQSNDVVVIVDLTQNKAMSNDQGTANPPQAVSVTLNQEKTEITSTVTDNIQWTLFVVGTQETPTYQFWKGNSYLYVTATNNGVRVGSGERNTFTIVTGGDNNGYYLYNSANNDNRFVGDYSAANWRCYTSINNNIKGNNNAFFKKVVDENACATPTFSVDEGYYSSTQNVEITCATEGATIYYTLNGSEPTENSTTYSSVIAISETTTIKAIAVKENYTNSSVASATYNIVTVQHAGTAQDPYTVADARNAIDLGTGLTGVYATGIVSEVIEYNSTYHNITYNISADGLTTSDQLQAYRGKGIDGADFNSEDDIQVGDTVVVSGTLAKYNGTYEFGQNNQLVSLQRPVAPAVPSIDVEETSINATAEEAEGTITVTYNNITNVAAEVYFCNAAGTEAAIYDWVDADINASNNVEYLIEANTGAARTAYLKVYALDDESNEVYSELITITQAACAYAVLPFFFDEGRADIENHPGLTQEGLDSDYGSSPKLKFNTTGDYLVLRINENAGVLSFDIKGNSFAGGTFSVQVSTDGSEYSNLDEFTALATTANMAYSLAAGVRYIKWIYTNKSNGNVALGNIKVRKPAAAITLGANGYSTFAADFKYTVSNAEVYEAALNNAQDAIILTKVENAVVPANAGIILKGTEGDVVTITPSNDAASDFAGNELEGVLAPTEAQANWYVLATNLDGDGLTKFHTCQAGIEIPANKAYMVIGEATAPSIRIIEAGNEATDIQNVEGAEKAVKFMENGKLFIKKNGVIYNAVGAKVK